MHSPTTESNVGLFFNSLAAWRGMPHKHFAVGLLRKLLNKNHGHC